MINLNGRACAIVFHPELKDAIDEFGVNRGGAMPAEFCLYTLDVSGLADALADRGDNPVRLSLKAFDHGAISVRHDYDLRAWAEKWVSLRS